VCSTPPWRSVGSDRKRTDPRSLVAICTPHPPGALSVSITCHPDERGVGHGRLVKNPVLRTIYKAIAQRALHPEAPLPPVDPHLLAPLQPDPEVGEARLLVCGIKSIAV
jgi:hypothetical protein